MQSDLSSHPIKTNHIQEPPHQLSYTIHSCSSCSPVYHPFNVLHDSPLDSSSRWSGSGPPHPSIKPNPSSNNPAGSESSEHGHDPGLLVYPGSLPKKKEYLILDLGKPCIVRSVRFGKFHRPHPCNVKLFRIWGSLAPGEEKGDFNALLDQQLSSSSEPQDQSGSRNKESSTNRGGDDRNHGSSKARSSVHRVKVRGERHRSGPRMELLAQGELKNDSVAETVQLRWRNNQVGWFHPSSLSPNTMDETLQDSVENEMNHSNEIIIPVRYLKFEPLSAAGSNYNCSIWHIAVTGHDEDHITLPALQIFEKWRTAAALRLCLKHLRQTGHIEAFHALLKSSADPGHSPRLVKPLSEDCGYPGGPNSAHGSTRPSTDEFYFEHSLVSALHSALIPSPYAATDHETCTLQKAEEIVRSAALNGLFDEWARGEPPMLTCHQIRHPPHQSPCPRGGHQMCIDGRRRKIWLFGGFDGYRDLADLWVYHLPPLSDSEDTVMTSGSGLSIEKMKMRDESEEGWELISGNVMRQNGPMNRSCHKMALDELTGDLYVLGRYTERTGTRGHGPGAKLGHKVSLSGDRRSTASPTPHNGMHIEQGTTWERDTTMLGDPYALMPPTLPDSRLRHPESTLDDSTTHDPADPLSSSTGQFKNDLFRFIPFVGRESSDFSIEDGQVGHWECLSRDTEAAGGPKLIFDHQMVLDAEKRKMYVFGGKVIQPGSVFQEAPALGSSSSKSSACQYSGLYEYDLSSRTWMRLMPEPGSEEAVGSVVPARMGHALVLDKKRDSLWILTGERDGQYYSDLWRFDLRSRRSELVVADYDGLGPDPGFSQRTTFDARRDEWHMFCGLCKDRVSGTESMSSEFWRWRVAEGKWSRVVLMAENEGFEAPPPRFAHQMVFDELTNHHYVFGGNPADSDNEPIRLGDFWRLRLVQATAEEALRKCLFKIRRQQFIEMCWSPSTDPVSALTYLQVELSAVTRHSDEEEAQQFRACTAYLISSGVNPDHQHQVEQSDDWIQSRQDLFEGLMRCFPASMVEPTESLVDWVDVWGDRETFW